MRRLGKIFILAITVLGCEHKKFLNPYDPINFPPTPMPLLPANNSTSTQNPPYFQWDIEEDSLNPLYGEPMVFEIQIDNNSHFSSVEFCDSNVYYKAYLLYYHLGEGNLYWRVRAKYLAGGWGEWSEVFNFNAKFPLVGSYNISTYGDIVINQGLAFLACGNNLNIIDISDPYNPELITTFTDSITFDHIFVANNYLYSIYVLYPEYEGKFSVYNIAAPLNPELLGRYLLQNNRPWGLWVEGTKGYICTHYYNTLIFDVSNPESLFIIDSLLVSGYEIIVKQNYAYILNSYKMDIADLSNNTIVSSVNFSGGAHSFWISENYACIAGTNTWIYDISDPANPALIYTINKESSKIFASTNFLFFYYIGYSSLLIYDISEPSKPEELGTIRNVSGQLYADSNFVYITYPYFAIFRYE